MLQELLAYLTWWKLWAVLVCLEAICLVVLWGLFEEACDLLAHMRRRANYWEEAHRNEVKKTEDEWEEATKFPLE